MHQTVVLLYLACSGVRGSSVGSHATVQEGGIPPIFRALCTFMLVLRLPRLVSRPRVGLATSPVLQPNASVLHTRRLRPCQSVFAFGGGQGTTIFHVGLATHHPLTLAFGVGKAGFMHGESRRVVVAFLGWPMVGQLSFVAWPMVAHTSLLGWHM